MHGHLIVVIYLNPASCVLNREPLVLISQGADGMFCSVSSDQIQAKAFVPFPAGSLPVTVPVAAVRPTIPVASFCLFTYTAGFGGSNTRNFKVEKK